MNSRNEVGMSRRQCLTTFGAMVAASLVAPLFSFAQVAPSTQPVKKDLRYKISACDWIMLKRQTPGAITRAKECGCDGVETDMGPLSKEPTFAKNQFFFKPGFTEEYLESCRKNEIEISSIAMSGYYAQPFPDRPYEQPLKDCIATCKLLGVKVAFLPLGVYSEFGRYPAKLPIIADRLKRIAGWAEEAGVVIGIESSLDAAGECALIDYVNSPSLKSYFNFENALQGGRDLCKELQIMGKDRICQIHATNKDVHWLKDDPDIDMPKVKKTLDDMGWSGWLVIERSRNINHGRDVVLNFSTNAKYLKSIFQPS